MIDDALDEHAGAKELIEQLNEMPPSDETYDAKVRMLQELIHAHVL